MKCKCTGDGKRNDTYNILQRVLHALEQKMLEHGLENSCVTDSPLGNHPILEQVVLLPFQDKPVCCLPRLASLYLMILETYYLAAWYTVSENGPVIPRFKIQRLQCTNCIQSCDRYRLGVRIYNSDKLTLIIPPLRTYIISRTNFCCAPMMAENIITLIANWADVLIPVYKEKGMEMLEFLTEGKEAFMQKLKNREQEHRNAEIDNRCCVCLEQYGPDRTAVNLHQSEEVVHNVCEQCRDNLRSRGYNECPICKATIYFSPVDEFIDQFLGSPPAITRERLTERTYIATPVRPSSSAGRSRSLLPTPPPPGGVRNMLREVLRSTESPRTAIARATMSAESTTDAAPPVPPLPPGLRRISRRN